jgi:hypothetical protein
MYISFAPGFFETIWGGKGLPTFAPPTQSEKAVFGRKPAGTLITVKKTVLL